MRTKYRATVAPEPFQHLYLPAGSFVLALFIHSEFSFFEILWTTSIYLEAVAIIPQLVLLQG
jgi:ER lumen protein retaining receptor